TNSNTPSYTVTGLSPNTTYCFTVLAKDASGNTSSLSNQSCETTTETSSGDSCASEDFENIPANDSAYTDRTWTGANGTWTATKARTDQTINNRAILIDCRTSSTGTITSPSILGGI
ncbi:MAG: fibronectin type III domain-containing protein, partial [Mangrovimonas sp.]|nr:fibronectin type III domain-containing protein [Mangrovimonas sp.]